MKFQNWISIFPLLFQMSKPILSHVWVGNYIAVSNCAYMATAEMLFVFGHNIWLCTESVCSSIQITLSQNFNYLYRASHNKWWQDLIAFKEWKPIKPAWNSLIDNSYDRNMKNSYYPGFYSSLRDENLANGKLFRSTFLNYKFWVF